MAPVSVEMSNVGIDNLTACSAFCIPYTPILVCAYSLVGRRNAE